MSKILSTLIVWVVVLSFVVTAIGNARADTVYGNPELIAWGGGGNGEPNVAGANDSLSGVSIAVNADTGNLIVVFAQATFQFTARSIFALTYPTSITFSQQYTSHFFESSNPSFWASYYMQIVVASGIAAGPVTNVVLSHNGALDNHEMSMYAAVFVYANASSVAAPITILGTSSYQNHYLPITTTAPNSTIAYFGSEIVNSNNNACPQVGSSSAKTAMSTNAYSYITGNVSGGAVPYGYYNVCSNNDIGARSATRGQNIANPQSVTFTFNNYFTGANWVFTGIEIIASSTFSFLLNGFDIGSVALLLIFFFVCVTAVFFSFKANRYLRHRGRGGRGGAYGGEGM